MAAGALVLVRPNSPLGVVTINRSPCSHPLFLCVCVCGQYNDNEAWTSGMNYPVAAAWHPWTVRCMRLNTKITNMATLAIVKYDHN